jgi:Transglycosylase SLT domain
VPQTRPCTVVLAPRIRRSLFLFPAKTMPLMSPSSGSGGRIRRAALGVGLAILPMFGCNGADAESAVPRPFIAHPAYLPFTAFVAEAAQRFGIPAAWIYAAMRAESFDDVRATLPRGAVGLMRIMPETWAELRRRYQLSAQPYDAHDIIMAGAAYLRDLHDRYGIPGFLAAYNAGAARWEDHLATGRPLLLETRAYLLRLVPMVGGQAGDDTIVLAAVVKSWIDASLFPALSSASAGDKAATSNVPPVRHSNHHVAHGWTALAPQSAGLFVALSSRERSQ